MFIPSSDTPTSFAGHRLILPCVSVGNVPQLSVDLFINTLKLSRVGYLEDESLVPVIGNDAFDHTGPSGYVHTSAEVYSSPDTNTTLVQIRAPIAKGCSLSFCKKLISWAKEERFSEVVVLTSSYAHERRDSQIIGEPYRYLLTSKASDLFSFFNKTLKWTPLEPRSALKAPESATRNGSLTTDEIFLPGSGQANKLYTECHSSNVKMVLLIAFCSQGDNVQDAVSFATYIDQWFELGKKSPPGGDVGKTTWLCPSSWSLMYGGPSPDNIF